MKKIQNIISTLRCYAKKLRPYMLSVLVVIITLGIPFLINESYKPNKGYITLWDAADVLAFYGSYISFVGSITLGAVAVYQNKKAHRLNEQMQKLQQAQFVSMISVKCLEISKRSSQYPNYSNPDMRNLEVLNLTADDFESDNCYHIDIEFSNSSSYPIVQINAQAGSRNNKNYLIFGMTNFTEKAIYIPEHGTKAFRFIVPCAVFKTLNTYKLALNLKFTNIFDYATMATIFIDDLENKSQNNEYMFRLSKFTDIRE